MILMGMTGMTYGLFLSTRVNDESEGVQASLGTFFPVLLLSGVMWPVEGIPHAIQWVSYIFPTMWGASAMRSVCVTAGD